MRFVLLFIILPFLATSQEKESYTFSFSLPEAATVSAGIFQGNTLIRTVFNNLSLKAGNHEANWDGLDDENNVVRDIKGLEIKVVYNNIKYEWEGVVGNTSAENSGLYMHRGFAPINYLVINADKAYYSKQYSEGSPSQNIFKLNDIQHKTRIFPSEQKGVGQQTVCIATDGIHVYWGGFDPFGGRTKGSIKHANYVFATDVINNSEKNFEKGVAYKNGLGRVQKSVADLTTDSSLYISGMAVQKKGRFLFIAHKRSLHIADKKSGELINEIAMPCNALATDNEDNIWVAGNRKVIKYAVSANGEIKELISISNLEQPVAIGIGHDNTVLIVDAGNSQQVKAFNPQNGKPSWVFGQEGGYYVSADVADDKFYFSDNRQVYGVSISFEDDGSFWLVDGGNNRVLHFSHTRKLVEHIMYLPRHYNIYVDPKVPGRVFCDFLEFSVDYSKPLQAGNGSWKFVRNWGAVIKKEQYNKFISFRPMLFPNARTYTLLPAKLKDNYEVVELTAESKLRFSGSLINSNKGNYLNPDGSIYYMPRKKVGAPMLFYKQPLTGFDENENPLWGPPQVIAQIEKASANDPAHSGAIFSLRPGEITSNNTMVVFDASGTGEGFHLGGIPINGNKWQWRTARGTHEEYKGPFPNDGSYDIGNGVQYAGNVALALGKFVLWGYHGEFWKNSQTNKWNLLLENGLMLGQFGITGPEVKGEEAAPGMAGNVFQGALVKMGNVLYLYHNDEGHHSGISRWKISNLQSVKEFSISIRPANVKKQGKQKVGLTKGLPFNKQMEDGLGGWKLMPAKQVSDKGSNTYWLVKTNGKIYVKDEDPDIFIHYQLPSPSVARISKQFDDHREDQWRFSAELNFEGNTPAYKSVSGQPDGGQYFELLDGNENPIIRFYSILDLKSKRLEIICNGTVIAEGDQVSIKKILDNFQPLVCRYQAGKLTVAFGNFKEKEVPVGKANPRTLQSVQMSFWNRAKGNGRRMVSIKNINLE